MGSPLLLNTMLQGQAREMGAAEEIPLHQATCPSGRPLPVVAIASLAVTHRLCCPQCGDTHTTGSQRVHVWVLWGLPTAQFPRAGDPARPHHFHTPLASAQGSSLLSTLSEGQELQRILHPYQMRQCRLFSIPLHPISLHRAEQAAWRGGSKHPAPRQSVPSPQAGLPWSFPPLASRRGSTFLLPDKVSSSVQGPSLTFTGGRGWEGSAGLTVGVPCTDRVRNPVTLCSALGLSHSS